MDSFDKGKVKFQNAFEYYDIMYNLNKYMLKASYAYNSSNINSANVYHRSIEELFYFVEPFLKESNMLLYYQNMIIHAINTLDIKDNQIKELFNCDKETSKELLEYKNEQINTISSMIDYSKRKLLNAGNYTKNKIELSKKLSELKQILDRIKRMIYQSMKDNKLTVPVNNYDASRAIFGSGT